MSGWVRMNGESSSTAVAGRSVGSSFVGASPDWRGYHRYIVRIPPCLYGYSLGHYWHIDVTGYRLCISLWLAAYMTHDVPLALRCTAQIGFRPQAFSPLRRDAGLNSMR